LVVCCSFLDTYFEEDLRKGRITEQQVQELVDQFVMKMRIVRWVEVDQQEQQQEWQECASAVHAKAMNVA
jgi:pyruvate-formate lyase